MALNFRSIFLYLILIFAFFTIIIIPETCISAESDKTITLKTGAPEESEWKSQELVLLGIGLAAGDLDGDGKNELVLIDPSTVYVYKFEGNELRLLTDYSANALELKSVDVMPSKLGPGRIFVSAQNRGTVVSFALELRNNKLETVAQDIPYFLRVIQYPTLGKILLGQRKGMRRMYDGPVYRMIDKGGSIEAGDRFGIPLKIPIFGFTIADLAGDRQPFVVAFDKDDHIRVYEPNGKKRFVSQEFYGGSDVLLRWSGPESRKSENKLEQDGEVEFFRPRIISFDNYAQNIHQIITMFHSSKTRRLLTRTKMLEEGQITGLEWNGDALVEKWTTPKLQGMITDFAVDTTPGSSKLKLIILERKKTDWLSFIRSRSQVRVIDLDSVMKK